MDKKLNEAFVQKIYSKIPQNIKPIEYLIGELGISKESAYRRVRGEIPFSLEELTALSLNLDFSVDEAIGNKKGNRIFFDLHGNYFSQAEESFLAMFKDNLKYAKLIYQDSNGELMASINRLSLFFLVNYDALFKLYFYKWIHQTSSMSVNCSFADIVIPEEILKMKDNFKFMVNELPSIEFVIDRNIFLSIVREIQYYYSRKLISDSDIVILKNELNELLNEMETLMQNGKNKFGMNYKFYLSLLDIETNTTWASFSNGNFCSLFWLYSVNSVYIFNKNIGVMHKKWFDTLKKYSVLITQSNELVQAKFIDKQRECIEDITNDLSFYQ